MQFIALDDLNRGLDPLHHAVGKRLARIAAVHQYTFDQLQIWLAPVNGSQSAVAVGYVGRGHGDGVGQPLRVDGDMPFDAGNLFARIVALLFGAVGVLYALRVNNDEAGLRVASKFDAGLANGFFLRPTPAHSLRPGPARSIWRSTHTP